MKTHQKITIAQLDEIAVINLSSPIWQPILLLGAPGQYKTGWCKERLPELMAEHYGCSTDDIGFAEEKPARRDATEIAGAGLPKKLGADFAEAIAEYAPHSSAHTFDFTPPPLWIAVMKQYLAGKTRGIILIDEVAAAGQPEIKVLRDLSDAEEHAIGGYKFPRGWLPVFTGNRAKDKSGSGRIMSHFVNTVLVFELVFDIDGLVKWYKSHGVNPIAIECALAHADSDFFADAVPAEDTAFCTPRSYYRASQHLDAFMASPAFEGTVTPLMERMLAANIGSDSASVLTQWIAQRDHVPSAYEIINNPEGCMVSDQTGFQMIAANVAMAAVSDARSATAVLHYIVRLRTDLQVSLGTKLMGISTRKGWTVTDPLAAAFIAKFHELIPLALMDN